jgi:hypothetical protein
MNNQHLIDSTIFDTTVAVAAFDDEQGSRIDQFIQKELMNVIDEVFDQVDRDLGNPGSVLRLDNLEIDLGKLAYQDYQQQMPAKLRARLLQALDDRRHLAGDTLSGAGLVDANSASYSQLFYFLRKGYLPWYARDTGSDSTALDSLLIEAIDSNPGSLIVFLRDNAWHEEVLTRLSRQFSEHSRAHLVRFLATKADGFARQVAAKLDSLSQSDEPETHSEERL